MKPKFILLALISITSSASMNAFKVNVDTEVNIGNVESGRGEDLRDHLSQLETLLTMYDQLGQANLPTRPSQPTKSAKPTYQLGQANLPTRLSQPTNSEGNSEPKDLVLAMLGAYSSAEFVKADMNDVHFLLWTKYNPDDTDYYELLIDNEINLEASPFDVSRPTLVLAHGWLSNGTEWPAKAKTELLSYFDCNVISIDWSKIADSWDYPAVVENLPDVGQHSADFLDFLHRKAGLNLTSLYLIGHSLGAHLVGFIGSDVVNGPIGRITGLDPAGPEYESATDRRLNQSDAIFVDIIHTNGCLLIPYGCFGLEANLGHVDYYPNGGKYQPGCTDDNICNHGRSHEYWVESVNGATPFTSRPCKDWEIYQAGDCTNCGQGCLNMGFHASTGPWGTYYLTTNAVPPYARG